MFYMNVHTKPENKFLPVKILILPVKTLILPVKTLILPVKTSSFDHVNV